MAKAKIHSTSQIKLTNKSMNKRMKSNRKHKLNKQPSSEKVVTVPNVNKSKKKLNINNAAVEKKYFSQHREEDNSYELDHDEVEFSDDEMVDFLSANSKNLSFLSTNLSGENNKKRRAKDDKIEDYEKVPRLLSKNSECDDFKSSKVDLLPIKGAKGFIQRVGDRQIEAVSAEVKEDTEDTHVEEQEEEKHLSFVELLAKRQNEINNKKIEIAQLSQDILEDPETNITILNKLIHLCGRDQAISIRKLAILSLLEVFKDIIPSYRIRELSEEEKTNKITRDVRKVRDFEEGLLTSYQIYLQLLEDVVKDSIRVIKRRCKEVKMTADSSIKSLTALAVISTHCLSDLLKSVPHFNYRTNIITVIVPKMELTGALMEAGQICVDTVKSVFSTDNVGDVALEVVKAIHKLVKTKPNVKSQVLETFLSLRINKDVIKAAAMKDNKIERLRQKRAAIRKMSRKEKKRKKVEVKLNKELEEAQAFESGEKIEKLQTEMLKLVLVIYFRILKAGHSTPLLSVVLKGLSKFAHLINVEIFDDLMASLERLLKTEELGLNERLNCIYTAFQILSGQGESLTIDPKQFYTELYSLMLQVAADAESADLHLVKQCLDIMLVKRRKQVSLPQVMGYFKRLSTLLLQQSTGDIFDIIMAVRNILQVHKKCDYLLDNETFGCGVFQPEITDPEHSNADSTSLWELHLISKHYHPDLAIFSKHILCGAPSQGPGALPSRLLNRDQRDKETRNKEVDLQEYFPDFIFKR